MKFLLDENFPLPLYHRLRDKGYDAEHVIELGQRGVSDAILRERLAAEELVFLTNDARRPGPRLFDLAPDGELYPWEIKDGVRSSVRSED